MNVLGLSLPLLLSNISATKSDNYQLQRETHSRQRIVLYSIKLKTIGQLDVVTRSALKCCANVNQLSENSEQNCALSLRSSSSYRCCSLNVLEKYCVINLDTALYLVPLLQRVNSMGQLNIQTVCFV